MREGRYRDTVTRPLTDLPVAGYPLVLRVGRTPLPLCRPPTVGGRCSTRTSASWRRRGLSTTRRCARYVLRRLMIDRTTVAAIAAELGVSWHTVSTIAMRRHRRARGRGRARSSGRGAGDRRRRAPLGATTRRGDRGVRHADHRPHPGARSAPVRARLLDMVAGRSAAALASWLADQATDVPRPGRGRGDGRVRRLQDRRHRCSCPTRSRSWTPSTSSPWPAPSST